MTTHFGNPSSIYSYGRESRLAIENARKSVATNLKVTPGEIFFTSGGTESDNMAIHASIFDLGCKHIISSSIEHHAVLHTIEHFQKSHAVASSFVAITQNGHIDLNNLEEQLKNSGVRCLVSLMHANNEIGNLLDLSAVGLLCQKYNAILHTDSVQTLGHYQLDLSNKLVHFATGAGHKFHGPKGVGILYVNDSIKINPVILGGGQERNMRAGTENLYGIVGFAKALEIAMQDLEKDTAYISSLKQYMISQLQEHIPGVSFNGDALGKSLYTVLNVSFPKTERSELLLFNLDMKGICVSGGSACSSGADLGSHVIRALSQTNNQGVPVRFSFSKHNTTQEIDVVITALKEILAS
jgi:cysteine desulfurase